MEEWKEYKLGEVCTISSSKRIFASEYQKNGIPFYRGKEIIEKQNGRKISNELFISEERYNEIKCKYGAPKEGDMLLSSVGTLGVPYIIQDETFYFKDGNLTWFYEYKGINNYFLYYWFLSPEARFLVDTKAIGSTQKALTIDTLKKFDIFLPPIDIQDKIVSILKSLDDKIEMNRRINDNLEQQAQALFKSWLSLCKYEVTIGDLSMNITDYTKCDQKEVVLINSSDVTEGYFTHHNLSKNENLKGHFKKRFTKGDILYSQVRPRNRHWGYCTFFAENYLASTQLMVIRNKKDIVPSILLYQYLIDDNVWVDYTLKTETRSGTFPQGNYEDLSSIKVPFGADVNDISIKLKSLYALLFYNEDESRRLAQLRDTLLPRLMSGELKVEDVTL